MDEPEEEPTDETKDGPTDEPAANPTGESEGRLAQEHSPADELTEEYPPDSEHMETLTLECPTLGWESPPGSIWEEDSIVVHTSEDEMDCWC